MAKITTLSGRVSHAVQTSDTSGNASGVSTRHSLSFRIDNRQVSYDNSGGTPCVAGGDYVTAAGDSSGGVFEVLALRNESTNVVWTARSTFWKFYGWVAILIGLPLVVVILGIPLVISGVLFIRKGYRHARANKLLVSAPHLAVPAQTS